MKKLLFILFLITSFSMFGQFTFKNGSGTIDVYEYTTLKSSMSKTGLEVTYAGAWLRFVQGGKVINRYKFVDVDTPSYSTIDSLVTTIRGWITSTGGSGDTNLWAISNGHLYPLQDTVVVGDITNTKSIFSVGGNAYTTNFQTSNYYNVKFYGAKGDSSTDDADAIQATFDAIDTNKNAVVYFPNGKYLVSHVIDVRHKGEIKIIGENATIINSNSATTYLFWLSTFQKLDIIGLKINMGNHNTSTYGIYIDHIERSVSLDNIEIYNFGKWDATGIALRYINDDVDLGGHNESPGARISNCNFYNSLDAITFDYNSNNRKGIGLKFLVNSEYAVIENCHFFGLSGGIHSDGGGANMTVIGNEFQNICNYVGALQNTACIYLTGASGNNGKIQIIGNKFNHNLGNIIYSDYNGSETRPIQIRSNYFIANSYDAVVFSPASTVKFCDITDNFFQRAYDFLPTSNYPFTGNRAFIKLTNVTYSKISGNTFDDQTGYAIMTYGTTDNNLISDNFYSSVSLGFDSLTGTTDILINNQDVSDIDGSFLVDERINFTSSNTCLGLDAGKGIVGNYNVLIGRQTGDNAVAGEGNVAIGNTAYSTSTSALSDYNTIIGDNACALMTTGKQNVILGRASGFHLTTGNANVFIGYNAGFSETSGSNKLYIENSNITTPLIYGEFDNDFIKINGGFAKDYDIKTTDYTIGLGDYTIQEQTASKTITLPSGTKAGQEYGIVNTSSGAITIATDGSDKLGNTGTSTSYSLASGNSVTVRFDGVDRWTLH